MSPSYHPASRGDKGSLSAVGISYSVSHPPQICCGIVNRAAKFWNNILKIKTLYWSPFVVLVTDLLRGPGCSFLAEPVSCQCFPVLHRYQSTEEMECACSWDQKPRAGLLGQQLSVFRVGGCSIWPGLSCRGHVCSYQEGQQEIPEEKLWLCVWYPMFVQAPQCSELGTFCPRCSSYQSFYHVQARLSVNPVCAQCRCFGNTAITLLSVQVSRG